MSKVNKPAGKRTRVNLIHDVSLVMCTALPNVTQTYDDASRPMYNSIMLEIVFNAALEHREWSFKITSPNNVDIFSGDEELGSVALEYSRRSGSYTPHLSADRLPSTRNRSGTFSHKEVAPILRKMREYVYPLTDDEIMGSHVSNVPSYINSQKYHAEHRVNSATEAMSTAALAFALDPAFKEQFLQYEATYGVMHKRDTAKAMQDQEAAVERMNLLEEMRVGSGTTHAVAALTSRGWFVKYNGVVTKHAEDELPETYSAVNALKLVSDNTAVPGLGLKVNDKTFVVVVHA